MRSATFFLVFLALGTELALSVPPPGSWALKCHLLWGNVGWQDCPQEGERCYCTGRVDYQQCMPPGILPPGFSFNRALARKKNRKAENRIPFFPVDPAPNPNCYMECRNGCWVIEQSGCSHFM